MFYLEMVECRFGMRLLLELEFFLGSVRWALTLTRGQFGGCPEVRAGLPGRSRGRPNLLVEGVLPLFGSKIDWGTLQRAVFNRPKGRNGRRFLSLSTNLEPFATYSVLSTLAELLSFGSLANMSATCGCVAFFR